MIPNRMRKKQDCCWFDPSSNTSIITLISFCKGNLAQFCKCKCKFPSVIFRQMARSVNLCRLLGLPRRDDVRGAGQAGLGPTTGGVRKSRSGISQGMERSNMSKISKRLKIILKQIKISKMSIVYYKLKFREIVHPPQYVTCHVSHVMCQLSCFICLFFISLFFLKKFLKLFG